MFNQVLAVELYRLQAEHHSGRGISCVRTLCRYLERDDREGAAAVANNESDKLRSYPEIVHVLRREGLWQEFQYFGISDH